MRNSPLTAAALTIAAALLAAPGPASALRIGLYGSSGAGSADWQYSEYGRDDVGRDTAHAGYGIVLDSGSPRTLADYRISLGWERIENAAVFDAPATTLEGFVVDQDLMFNLIRHPGPLRIWLGPEFRIAFLNSSDTRATGGREDFVSLGVGPVVGFDFGLSPALAISWKVGYLASGVAGSRTDGFSFSEGHAYAAFAILFSTWGGHPDKDRYEERIERRPRRDRSFPGRW